MTVNSTLGAEAILRGKKTCFFTNLPQDRTDPEMRIFSPLVAHLEKGFYWVNNGSVKALGAILNRLHGLSEAQYLELIDDAGFFGIPDPGLFRTRKLLAETCPALEEIIEPLTRPVLVEGFPT